MARQTLFIGDTGAEFVSKFNNNFDQTFANNNEYYYNVETYGAVHDGVTDDTVAIQTAINACHAAGGGTVYFPIGIYIIAGELQNNIGEDLVDYNSQLYIPYDYPTGQVSNIRLVGESWDWLINFTAIYEGGVVLKSTINGTGTFPSVICALGKSGDFGTFNYNVPSIENIKIVVNAFETTTGPTMCGINFVYASYSYLNNVTVTVDCLRDDFIEPDNHVFGVAVGRSQDDFPQIGKIVCAGFYYGAILGEGVVAQSLHTYYNHIGLMCMQAYYGIIIHQAVLHWNTYKIASLQESMFGIVAGRVALKINYCNLEDGNAARTPEWCRKVDYILDSDNYLFGELFYVASRGLADTYIPKANGGHNLLTKNIYDNSEFHWTTDTRPTLPGSGCRGFNTTTKKLEYWNESAWVEIPAAT